MSETSVLPDKAALVDLKVACSTCSLRELCLPVGINASEIERLDQLVERRVAVPRGACLYQRGEPFQALFAVKAGFFKTRASSGGREHVTGFQMAGEVLGLDGIGTERHTCDAVALEDSQVCRIEFDQLAELSRRIAPLQRHLHRLIGREVVRDQRVMMLLGTMRAEQRLAAFLLNLSQRFAIRGFSASAMLLRMTREEMGSYLGLKLETVSRCLSKFADDGVLAVHNRDVRILNPQVLEEIVEAATI